MRGGAARRAHRPRLARSVATLLALGACLPAALGAQVVRGVVVNGLDGAPLRGAVVLLVNGRGQTEAGAFADDSGAFALRAAPDSTYALVVERVGFARARVTGLLLHAGETMQRRVRLAPLAVRLDQVVVHGDRRCEAMHAGDTMVVALWERVRATLDAVSLTGRDRMLRATVSLFARTVDTHGRVRDTSSSTIRGTTTNPFVSVPLDTLARYGYAHRSGDTTTYYAPDAGVLVSASFTGSHCFRVQAADTAHAGAVGLAFEPAHRTRHLDVHGVLWLAVRSGELHTLEFEYVAGSAARVPHGFGGRLRFQRLPSGATIVRDWQLVLPAPARPRVPRSAYEAPDEAGLARFVHRFDKREVGGTVLTLRTADGRVLFPTAPRGTASAGPDSTVP